MILDEMFLGGVVEKCKYEDGKLLLTIRSTRAPDQRLNLSTNITSHSIFTEHGRTFLKKPSLFWVLVEKVRVVVEKFQYWCRR